MTSPRDDNRIAGLIAKSDADNTLVVVEADPATKRLKTNATITGTVTTESPVYKKLIDDTTTASVTYIGEAALGSATSASVWRIQKIDETSGVVITWSGTGFDAEWDERTISVVYS